MKLLTAFVVFLLLLFVEGELAVYNVTRPSWLLHKPNSFVPDLKSMDDLVAYEALMPPRRVQGRKRSVLHDEEDYTVLDYLMYGKVGGSIIEMGACDGTIMTGSKSVIFESIGWKRILVDPNVKWIDRLISESPNAMSVSAAACLSEGVVHFLKNRNYVTSGVLEFMPDDYMKRWHPWYFRFKNSIEFNKTGWATKVSHMVYEVPCLPFSKVIKESGIDHINVFILDVEGGELNVLNSIDWNDVIFDVIAVETEPSERPVGYADKMIEFMAEKGYRCIQKLLGRNTWFAHKSFIPTVKPGMESPFDFN